MLNVCSFAEHNVKALLTSALDGGNWSASSDGHITPKKRGTGTQCLGSWVGPRAKCHTLPHFLSSAVVKVRRRFPTIQITNCLKPNF